MKGTIFFCLILMIGLILGCDSEEENPVEETSSGSEVLLREGNQQINISSGPTPSISWTGGNIGNLGVERLREINGKIYWECLWSIWTEGKGDLISSSVTYGTLPSEAENFLMIITSDNPVPILSSGGCMFSTFERLVPGEQYKITIVSNSHIAYSQTDDSQISTLYFIR